MIGLGRILADAREARGLTLEEVERETRISRRYLQALESEEFDVFPARVQARGFLRLYAQYLGVDPAEMLALFPSDIALDDAPSFPHSERILGNRPERQPLVLPTIDLRRPPFVLVGAFLAVIVLCGLVTARCASHEERVRAGLSLLAEGSGATAMRVPDVHDDTLDVALQKLSAVGITPLVIEERSDRVAAGLIIRQSPAGGSAVSRGSDVVLFVSRGRQ
jgi:transcriptional regulator with XRE-family HTH domain